MRIAVDGRPLHHPYTGIGVYTFELLSRMADEHELFVYLDRELRRRPAFRATFRAGSGRRLRGMATAHFLFARWARQDAVDVFWGPRHNLPLALRGIPGVVTVHDMVWRRAPETMKPLNRLIDSTLMPIALAQAASVLAVSADSAEQVRRFCGRRDVVATPLAARRPTITAPFSYGRPFFLWVGQREPRKNLAGIIAGFRRAVQCGMTSHDLVLVGPRGWKQAGLAATIAGPGVSERIIDLGAISDELLAGVYQACAALVLASFYEGFGIPLLEAMQYGKPVIASGRGSMQELGGDAALLVDPDEPNTIAAAFMRLARDTHTYCQLAANAKRRSKLYSWDRTARDTIAVLAAAAGSGAGGKSVAPSTALAATSSQPRNTSANPVK